MKYGIREICDVVFKAKSAVKIGNKEFKAGEPVIYFDTLKTSTLEGAATTVYAQGGKGNARLIAWEGERTVTFTMEDALISELGLSVLTGAGIVEPKEGTPLKVHTTARFAYEADKTYTVEETIVNDSTNAPVYVMALDENDNVLVTEKLTGTTLSNPTSAPSNTKSVMFDFYIEKASGAKQIEITPDKFAGTYYVEASTLFRDANGADHPAEFIIPSAKVQSNFNFSLASSGDPTTFTFTLDAFPGYTKFDPSKKVFAVIQVIEDDEAPLIDGVTTPSGEDD